MLINVISLLLIFIENSIALNYSYNFVAVPYITFLIYRKGVDSLSIVLLVAFIISFQSISFVEAIVGVTIFYLVFYILSTMVAYEKYNIPFFVIIQVVLYSSMVYLRSGDFGFWILLKLIVSYTIFNYLYLK